MVNSCDNIDCRPPGSSVYGILQARILEWVVISFSMCTLVDRLFFQIGTNKLRAMRIKKQSVSVKNTRNELRNAKGGEGDG